MFRLKSYRSLLLSALALLPVTMCNGIVRAQGMPGNRPSPRNDYSVAHPRDASPGAYSGLTGSQPVAPAPASENSRADAPGGEASDYPATDVRFAVVTLADAARARAEYRQARDDLYQTVDWARQDMTSDPALVRAEADEQAAYDAYQSATARVHSTMLQASDYVAALRLRDRVAAQLADQKDAQYPDKTRLVAIARVKLDVSSQISQYERDALDADSGVQQAKASLAAASRKLAQVRGQLDKALRRSAIVLGARHEFESARIQNIAANALADAAVRGSEIALDYAYYVHRYDDYRYLSDRGSDYGYPIYGGISSQYGAYGGYRNNILRIGISQ